MVVPMCSPITRSGWYLLCRADSVTRRFAIPFALAAAACAQSLVEPERLPEVRQAFERAGAASTLRCEITPVKPVLTFGLRFRTGYGLSVPMSQFSGAGHKVTVHVRVSPENRDAVYLTITRNLPEVKDTKADGVADGAFLVGEGPYRVDLLVVDDQQRSCRSTWQIQAIG